jgi:hypothetical protein
MLPIVWCNGVLFSGTRSEEEKSDGKGRAPACGDCTLARSSREHGRSWDQTKEGKERGDSTPQRVATTYPSLATAPLGSCLYVLFLLFPFLRDLLILFTRTWCNAGLQTLYHILLSPFCKSGM